MKKILFIIFIGGLLSACSGLVEGLNDDPNNPTATSYQFVLTGAQVGNTIVQTGEIARKAGIFCGYYTGIDRQHEGFSQYAVTTSDFDAQWNDVYVKAVVNALAAEEAAVEEGIGNVTIGITQVVRALALGTATSLWGDVPFDDAGSLDVEDPAFDGQIAVYGKLQGLLDQAIDNLEAGTGRPASGSDIHFDGNAAAWIAAAYTLKARYYMHTREYGNAYNAALNGINTPDGDLATPHGTAEDDANLNFSFFAVEVRQADLITSEFLTSIIDPDPATNPIFDNYRGNAKTNETARFNYLLSTTSFGVQPNTADGFAAQDAPAPLVTYAENLLILAEAGFRSQGFATGLQHLNEFRSWMATGGYLTNANMADLQYDAYVAADFDNGGIENADGLSSDDALLREILEERYITFFGMVEGFNDTRRTEKEADVRVPVQPNVGAQLPQRFLYPTTEIDRNPNAPNPVPDFFAPTPVNQ
jgi:hypothetical protein